VSGSVFNAHELAAQALAGGGPRGSGIRDFLPEQHRHFFSQMPYVLAGAVDDDGWPLATLLWGHPGFVRSPDPQTLHIATLPDTEDPANAALSPNREIGILGIDFSTRRRNRVNGRIVARDSSGIRIAVGQSFGNCPQYIQLRALAPSGGDPAAAVSKPVETIDHLDEAARAAIAGADTFFVASRSRPGEGAEYGADISHRGGRPGFVRVDGDQLTIPDFRGNRYFNTLGNLIAEPRASLLFVDFAGGGLLQLQGTSDVDWSGASAAQFDGAERLWRFRVTRGWRRKAASPLRWSFIEYSRTTLQTGLWRGHRAP
jgi:predicted pyridoxine 5'-phosphate oxidase superfamily flavin-nucleotide-binding protein